MNRQDLKKYKLPDEPGVYLFLRQAQNKSNRPEVIYVGKATSLADRVKSYFGRDLMLTRGPKIIKMVEDATSLDFQVTDSVLEALILEANLIKKYQPSGNTDGKDDKSFNFIVITNEDFPVVKTMRGRSLLSAGSYKYVFGPYPHGNELKEALKIIRRIFPYRDEKCLPRRSSNKGGAQSGGGCFNYQIGLCPGTCVGAISQRDYAKVIRRIKLFFEGQKDKLIKDLTSQMNRLAKELQFEAAGELKKKIFALQHIRDVALLKNNVRSRVTLDTDFRIESYDVAHISGKYTVGAMAVMEGGELQTSAFRKFKLHQVGDTANLEEILNRRFTHPEWRFPDLIVVDGSTAQINVAEKVLADRGLKIPVVAVTKDDKHRAREIKGLPWIIHDYRREIIELNAAIHRFAVAYHRQRRDKVI